MSPPCAARSGLSVSDQTMWSARLRGDRRPTPSQILVKPHALGPTEEIGRAVVVGADEEEHVAGSGQEPQCAARHRTPRGCGRATPFADDHGVHELHCHVPGMGGPLRCHAPHGGSRRRRPGPARGRRSPTPRLVADVRGVMPGSAPLRCDPRGPPVRAPGRRRWGVRTGASAPRGRARASIARARRSTRTFWKTPPLSATRLIPERARRSTATRAMSSATARWNPAAMGPTRWPARRSSIRERSTGAGSMSPPATPKA